MTGEPKRPRRFLPAVLALLALPVLYLLALGPLVYCDVRGWLPDGTLEWRVWPVEEALPGDLSGGYVEWWARTGFNHAVAAEGGTL